MTETRDPVDDRPQPTTLHRLCRLDEIADPGSAGFTVPSADGPVEVMVIRRGHRAFVYVNLCPHWDAPLDMKPGQFLDRARQHIQCANHGAVFRIEDGFCLSGPCRGASLRAVPSAIVGDDGPVNAPRAGEGSSLTKSTVVCRLQRPTHL